MYNLLSYQMHCKTVCILTVLLVYIFLVYLHCFLLFFCFFHNTTVVSTWCP